MNFGVGTFKQKNRLLPYIQTTDITLIRMNIYTGLWAEILYNTMLRFIAILNVALQFATKKQ